MIDGVILNLKDIYKQYSLTPILKVDEDIRETGSFNLPENPLDNPFPEGIEIGRYSTTQHANQKKVLPMAVVTLYRIQVCI